MKPFVTENFLLGTGTARELYFSYAADMPVIDYHNHLPPAHIARDYRFGDLTEIWLAGDHYKWRAMRTNGVAEEYCTGSAGNIDKFRAWAATVPYTVGNPLYHWTHMELHNPFGITDRLLNKDTADEIYNTCTDLLQTDAFSTCALLKRRKVQVVCTTDDPADSLQQHIAHARQKDSFTKMFPAWRADQALVPSGPAEFNNWLSRLSEASDTDIVEFQDLLSALERRHAFFHDQGCRISDHGIETFYAEDYQDDEIAHIFNRLRTGHSISKHELTQYRSALLYHLAILDHSRGWVQQFHYGALRNNNSRMYMTLGPDTGFDSMGAFNSAQPMARFLDRLDSTNQLAKTIIYNINPGDNELVATIVGSFQDGLTPGKLQFGSAWWFMDTQTGMERQLEALANLGLLSRFVGMLTDSRSFLSFSRHEYFRRILCNFIGARVEQGLYPNDLKLLGEIIQNICYNNAAEYFKLI